MPDFSQKQFKYATLWSQVDTYIGMFLGLYSPLRYFAGDHDCFGSWFESTLSIANFHNYFDKDYNKLPQLMMLSLIGVSYKFYKTYFICVAQYDDQIQAGWFTQYDTSTLKVKSSLNSPDWLNYVEQIIGVAEAGWNLKSIQTTNYFYFKKGVNAGNLVGQSIILLQYMT